MPGSDGGKASLTEDDRLQQQQEHHQPQGVDVSVVPADSRNKGGEKRQRRVFGVDASDVPWKIYVSRALSAWGDRMWSYGSGLFMTSLDEEGSLRVVAIYGFVSCLSIIILGPVIGNWIDRSNRLTSAQAGANTKKIFEGTN